MMICEICGKTLRKGSFGRFYCDDSNCIFKYTVQTKDKCKCCDDFVWKTYFSKDPTAFLQKKK